MRMTTRLIAMLLIVGGAAQAELKVGDESAEAWKERVFKTNDCASLAFEAGRIDGFLSGYDAARDEYASDDCLTAGECDSRADVRWIKGWQDGFSNGIQCAKYFGVRLIELTVTNYVTVTQECRRQHCTNYCLNCGTWRPNKWLGDGVIATNNAGVEK